MNQMTLAMQAAAAKAPGALAIPPATQRIWQWLHDKGGYYTAKEIERALKIKPGSVGSALYELLSRGTAEKRAAQRRGAHPALSFEWTAVGTVYTRPPVKPEFRKKPKVKVLPKDTPMASPYVSQAQFDRTFPVQAPPIKAQGPTPEAAPKIDIDSMTVREARALYDKLQLLFGGQT